MQGNWLLCYLIATKKVIIAYEKMELVSKPQAQALIREYSWRDRSEGTDILRAVSRWRNCRTVNN